ncbi:hypothetical protein P167DRAFT_550217 [Morchella conica CCBAS932]|uniref:Uncharacterized protein n=1 Tax=Morchella conica CCBAS932 TaxID=1392247 RepID=A0A3N4KC35_9PEZI|nr:hypothetical protein P167DRAFT_550217 [Morchella conica CCBAS932]
MGTPVLNKSEVFALIEIVISLLGVIVSALGVIELRRRRRSRTVSSSSWDVEDIDTVETPRIQPAPLHTSSDPGTIHDIPEAATTNDIPSPYSVQGSSQSRLNEHPSQQ